MKEGDVKNMTLQEQAEAIMKEAREKGVNTNFFFVTTFKRYQIQMKMLNDIEKWITEDVEKGDNYHYERQEYNKTATAANNTAKTLIDIINRTEKQG